MTTLPRIAVMGCGHWGKNLARNFAELGALVAVCDHEPQKAQEIANLHGVDVCTEAEVFTRADIDAIVLATLAPLHEHQAAMALEAGKHVYIEKPMALTTEGAQRLVDLSTDQNRLVMVGHILHYHPAVVALKQYLPQLGRLHHIYSNRLALGRFRHHESILWDLASHDVSVILSLADAMPTFVSAVGHAFLTRTQPAAAFVNLTFPSGMTAHIHTSWISPFKEQKMVVVGEKGIMVFDDRKPWAEKLSLSINTLQWVDGKPEAHPSPEEQYLPLPEAEPLREECAYFLDCLRHNVHPLTDAAEGLRVTQVLEKAEQSLNFGL